MGTYRDYGVRNKKDLNGKVDGEAGIIP